MALRQQLKRYVHTTGCIEWVGSIGSNGYGRINRNDSKETYAHRYFWEKENGIIPNDKIIDHKCRNRKCINVDHLRLTTYKYNVFNRTDKKFCGKGHEFTDSNTYIRPNGVRQCVECQRGYVRQYEPTRGIRK